MRSCKTLSNTLLFAVLIIGLTPDFASSAGVISASIRCEINTTETEMPPFRYILTLAEGRSGPTP